MTRTLISNATLVNEGRIQDADVLVNGERIEQIGASIAAPDGARIIDARGRYLIPGMIDDQVHFREPGLTSKGDLASESAAAVAGGVTGFMDMPNVNPLTVNREAVAAKYALAAGRVHANCGFYLGATNNNIEEIKALQPNEACGVKIFMGASTGDMLVDDKDALHDIFRDAPVIVLTHCEDSPTIWANEAQARAQYGEDVPLAEHPNIRSAEACLKSSAFAVSLAQQYDTRLHVLHLTTAKEMALFERGDRNSKRITAEVCVHHLWFYDSDYASRGTLIKCNPAIKRVSDRDALLQAVNEDRIDIIATDHAPHTWDEKHNTYFKAPAGLPLVQHALPSLFDQVKAGRMNVQTVVDKTSHATADIFGIVDRGYVREGYYADLVLVDPQRPAVVNRDNVLYKCGWSPFDGHTFSASIDMTMLNGTVVFEDGKLVSGPIGQRMEFRAQR